MDLQVKVAAMEANVPGCDNVGIVELEQVDIQPPRSRMDSQVEACNGSSLTMLELQSWNGGDTACEEHEPDGSPSGSNGNDSP